MNAGIQDGVALYYALSVVCTGQGDDSVLDQYERTRRPIAERVVAFTDRLTKVATQRTPGRRALRNAMLGLVGHIPAIPRLLATELAGLRFAISASSGYYQRHRGA